VPSAEPDCDCDVHNATFLGLPIVDI
jgi:hypothetical protein